MANTEGNKSDPIRHRYFKPLEQAELWTNRLFIVGAALSLIVVLLDKSNVLAYQLAQISFLTVAIVTFIIGQAIRLYWGPRSQQKRISDFLSHAYRVRLTHEETKGYYNNNGGTQIERIGLQLLENSFFSKELSKTTCEQDRWKLGLYILIWLLVLLYRNTPIDMVVAVSMIVFGEQIISRWARLEWLRAKFENVFDATYKLLQSRPVDQSVFDGLILEHLISYENAKAIASITMSSRLFEKHNDRLSREWIRLRDGIAKRI